MRFPALLLLLLLAACGSPGATPPPLTGAEIEGSWSLISGHGQAGEVPIVDGGRITLTISGREIGGRAACNHYGGELEIRDGRVTMGELSVTAMGCPEQVAAAEAAYLAALGGVSAIRRDGRELVLEGPSAELRFEPLPEPPTAELTETSWVLDTIFVGDVAGTPLGEPASLQLRSDGGLSGSTGCRAFEGRWAQEGEQIVATAISIEDVACPDDLRRQDEQILTVLGDGFVPSVEGSLLTVTDPGSIGLVYRARD